MKDEKEVAIPLTSTQKGEHAMEDANFSHLEFDRHSVTFGNREPSDEIRGQTVYAVNAFLRTKDIRPEIQEEAKCEVELNAQMRIAKKIFPLIAGKGFFVIRISQEWNPPAYPEQIYHDVLIVKADIEPTIHSKMVYVEPPDYSKIASPLLFRTALDEVKYRVVQKLKSPFRWFRRK